MTVGIGTAPGLEAVLRRSITLAGEGSESQLGRWRVIDVSWIEDSGWDHVTFGAGERRVGSAGVEV